MAYTNDNALRVQLGTCSVTFGETDLGLTKGGVEVTVSTTTYKINVDQFGQTELNEYVLGRTAMVKVPMAETDLDKLLIAIPGSTLVTDATVVTKKKLLVKSDVGLALRSYADELVCAPIAQTATANDKFTMPIAAPKGEFKFAFKHDEERVYEVEFTGYPDLTTGVVYIIGDSSATAV